MKDDDARALVRLLWRGVGGTDHTRTPRKGPRQRFTVDEIVDAGVALADAEGLAAVTMRSLAARLGAGPMSLYTYVPTRDVLVALMVDAVAVRRERIPPRPDPREALAAAARAQYAEYLAHPWLLDVPRWRDVLGPGRLGRYEEQLALVEGLPVDDLVRNSLVASIDAFTAGAAREAAGARAVSATSGMSDARWWEIVGPELAEAVPAGAFPIADRVGTAVGEAVQGPGDPAVDFEYGLGLLLDGLFARLS